MSIEEKLPTIQCTGAEVTKRLDDAIGDFRAAVAGRNRTAENAAFAQVREIRRWILAASERLSIECIAGWQLDHNAAVEARYLEKLKAEVADMERDMSPEELATWRKTRGIFGETADA